MWRYLFSLALTTAVATLGNLGTSVHAQQVAVTATKLTAPALLPERTLAYLRIDNVKEMKDALGRSTIGKLSADEKIKPILMEFYGSLVNSTEAIREYTGLNSRRDAFDPVGRIGRGSAAERSNAGPRSRTSQRGRRSRGASRSQSAVRGCHDDAGEEIAGVQVLLQRMQEQLPPSMEHDEAKLGNLTLHQ